MNDIMYFYSILLSFFLSFLLHRRETNTRLLASLLYRSYRRLRHWTKKQIWRLCSTRSNRLDTTGELQWVLFKRGLSFPLLENFSFLFLQCQQCRGCIYLECALDLLWPTPKRSKSFRMSACEENIYWPCPFDSMHTSYIQRNYSQALSSPRNPKQTQEIIPQGRKWST